MLGCLAFGKLAYPAGERVPMLYARAQSDLRQLDTVAWPAAAPERAAALARSLHDWVFERSGLTRRIQSMSAVPVASWMRAWPALVRGYLKTAARPGSWRSWAYTSLACG